MKGAGAAAMPGLARQMVHANLRLQGVLWR